MTPLERMAKAAWDRLATDDPWESLSNQGREENIENMRAALLSLAEAELPDGVKDIGWETYVNSEIDHEPAMAEIFKAMTRAIAGEKTGG
jgi:hypothetical protein